MKVSRLVFIAVVSAVVIAITASLFLSFGLKRFARFFFPTPSLAAYGVDIQQTSVSGVSSGGAMALQMHVAHSSIMRGVGVLAGVAYACTDPRLLVAARVLRGFECMDGAGSLGGAGGAAFSIARTADAAAVPGAIDDPAAHLPSQKIWLFSGYNDGMVRRAAMDAVALYYAHYVDAGNIFYKNNNRAPHALVTDNYGGPCLGFNSEFINNCGYNMAGHLLHHIYGALNQRNGGTLSGSIAEFDQTEFVKGGLTPASVGLADTGYVYVPGVCRTQTCRVHVVFHGCQQYAGLVGGAVYRHSGYNEWADTNRMIVLYPQTAADADFNPKGCWDWWGLDQLLPLNSDFARKAGYQVSAIKAMLDRLAQNFAAGWRIGYLRDTAGLLGTRQHRGVSSACLAGQQRRGRLQCVPLVRQQRSLCENKQQARDRRQLRGPTTLPQYHVLLPANGREPVRRGECADEHGDRDNSATATGLRPVFQ